MFLQNLLGLARPLAGATVDDNGDALVGSRKLRRVRAEVGTLVGGAASLLGLWEGGTGGNFVGRADIEDDGRGIGQGGLDFVQGCQAEGGGAG